MTNAASAIQVISADHVMTEAGSRRATLAMDTGPVVCVTGAIAPYTHRVYEAMGEQMGGPLYVLTCVDVEPQRGWETPQATSYVLEVMSGLRLHRSDTQHVYLNAGVLARLAQIRPRAIMLHDFSPTMLLACAYARLTGTPYAIVTDGSRAADPGYHSRLHAWSRRLVVPGAKVGIGASEDSLALLRDWGLAPTAGVVAPIAAAWDAPAELPGFDERPYDVIFCGAIEDQRKGVAFLVDVLIRARERGHTMRCRFVGNGPLRAEVGARLAARGIPATFDGYLQPRQIAAAYCSARVLAFPTRSDCWGLVANEAILCGTPVVSSPHAVSAIELVERNQAGIVCELDVDAWATALISLTRNRARWDQMHAACEPAAQTFALDRACAAMMAAIGTLLDRR